MRRSNSCLNVRDGMQNGRPNSSFYSSDKKSTYIKFKQKIGTVLVEIILILRSLVLIFFVSIVVKVIILLKLVLNISYMKFL